MKIKLASPFKSLNELSDIELPRFIILTGLNGVGKTQLLQAILAKNAVVEIDGKPASNIKMFSGGLGDVVSKPFYGNALERFCIRLQDKISNYRYYRTLPQCPDYYKFDTFFSQVEKQIITAIRNAKKNKADDEVPYADRVEIMRNVPHSFIISEPDPSTVQKNGQDQDVFQHDLSQIFKRYHILQEQNDVNCYLKERKGKVDLEALSKEEFVAKYGEPPWILANDILLSARMGYTFTTPENQGIDDPFVVNLVSQLSGCEISFADLSSGEKVLMSLALALYGSHYDRVYPEILLLDEPDCHLHPSMAGNLLRVIEEVFVLHRNVPVIMTTHSPSTVALSSEDCLYVMMKEGGRISKQPKDRCIKVLTTGVPALSVDYDNRVTVFVESKHDARNYGDIYEAIKDNLASEISLSFISSGSGGSGSADQVREIVGVLRSNGNTKIFGVIDWDGKNSGGDFVKVAASGRRYGLENLILDPLLIGIYLIREGHLESETAGLIPKLSYVRLANLQPNECETLAAYVTGELSKYLPTADNRVAQASYVGNFQIPVSAALLENNGHELEAAVKNAFAPLKRFRNENALKSDVIRKVMVDFPQFVPAEFAELFWAIQRGYLE